MRFEFVLRSVRELLVAGIACVLPVSANAIDAEYEHDAIDYSGSTPNNAVSRLQDRITAGETSLEYDPKTGWLRSLLREFAVDEASQMLVFSKTSLQRNRIAPRTPRAVYFADDVYVGFCRSGDLIEVAAADPRLGAVFYTLDQKNADRPTLTRQTDNCLTCHASSAQTGGVPGFVVRSVYSDSAGLPILSAGSFRTDHSSPLEQRWGGWYVTGTHGHAKHLGNLIAEDKENPARFLPENLNVTNVSGRFDASSYPTPHSDIVALMVLEHQTAAHNTITAANFATRRALWDEKALDDAFGDGADSQRESTTRRINNAAEKVLETLLFSGEAKLTSRIAGTSGFAESFAPKGPRDSKGRSLRDFDLESRMFKHPCSYLSYSAAFDGLPDQTRERIYLRLHEVLTGKYASEKFAYLSPSDRHAIREILLDTKPGLPEYWRRDASKEDT